MENAASVWKDVKSQAPITQQNLIPLTKLWSQKTEEEMEAYQENVADQASAATPPLAVATNTVIVKGIPFFVNTPRALHTITWHDSLDVCSYVVRFSPKAWLGLLYDILF